MENNSTNNSNKMRFNLLREEVEAHDLIEDKTHEKVAESIAELIKSEKEGGVTIGLEGSWGSGKSFVISLLKEKLKESNSIKFIEFDAWAHQGDPLRRVFLKSILEEVSDFNENQELIKLRNLISKRTKKTRIRNFRSITWLGILLSISAFIVPIGLAIITYTIQQDESSNLFWFGLLLVGAPIIVIFFNFLQLSIRRLFKKIDKVCSINNWSFVNDISSREVSQHVSEEEERSSIEFEDYFKQILGVFFKEFSSTAKLVIVIDNLDRVDSKDALKIWSTLQTFLQQRSSLRKENWFNKIWIIVPYDRDGLAALWENGEAEHDDTNNEGTNNKPSTSNDQKNKLAKAFFDKNFQIRYEISRPILSSWIDFLRQMVDKAFANWDVKQKSEVVDVLEITRKDIADVPTPREIKNYVNQVGVFASQFADEIPIKSIAYYIVLRQFEWLNKDEIRQKLINIKLPKEEHIHFLPKSIKEDLAGLVFGVSPKKGNLLLLEPEIKKSLLNANDRKLKELSETHGNNFWDVTKYHIPRCKISFKESLNYAHSFKLAFGEEFNLVGDFINKIYEVIENKEIQLDFNSDAEFEKYKSIMSICITRGDKPLSLTLYSRTIELTEAYFKETKEVPESLLSFFNEIKDELISHNIEIEQNDINFGSIENFLQWCVHSEKLNTNLWEYILPSVEIISQLKIPTGKNIPQGTLEAVKYLINAKADVEWEKILDDCKNHIKHSDGTYQQNFHSDEVFEIITIVSLSFNHVNKKVKEILSTGQYYHLFNQRKGQNILHAAIVCGYIFGQELQTINVTQVGQSSTGIKLIQQFWSDSDKERAKKVFNYITKYEQYDFLWSLAVDSANKLVTDIISLIANDDIIKQVFFNVKDGLSKIKNYKKLIADRGKNNLEEITGHILKYGDLKNEILTAEELDLVEYAEELVYVVSEANDIEVINHISDLVKELNTAEWLNDLAKDLYLTSLALEIKKKNKSFDLDDKYYDAVIDFCTSEEFENITSWQKENWEDLIDLLAEYYKQEFKKRISKYFIEKDGKVSKTFLDQLSHYLDKVFILKKENFLADVIIDFLQADDFESIKPIIQLFSPGEVNKHGNTEKNKIQILNDRLQTKMNDGDDEHRAIYEQLAGLFNIELKIKNDEPGEKEDDQKN